jgi:hypothetical protein
MLSDDGSKASQALSETYTSADILGTSWSNLLLFTKNILYTNNTL